MYDLRSEYADMFTRDHRGYFLRNPTAYFVLQFGIFSLFSRLPVRHTHFLRRKACIMPAIIYKHPSCLVAVYSRKFWTLLEPTSDVGLACVSVGFVWGITHEMNILGISVISLLSVNLFLVIFNMFLSPDGPGVYSFGCST